MFNKDKEYAALISNLHVFLREVKFLKTPNKKIDTADLFVGFLKDTLKLFKKSDREAVIALLEIVEKEFFVGINAEAHKTLQIETIQGTKFRIGQNLKNRKGDERFIIAIYKESKKGEIQYEWIDPRQKGIGSVCSENTMTGWKEK